jgi:hypothetical protein
VIEKHTTYNSRGSDNAAKDSKVQKKLGVKVGPGAQTSRALSDMG